MALRKTASTTFLRQAQGVLSVTTSSRPSSSSTNLKEAIAAVIPEKVQIIKDFRAKYDKAKVGDVTVDMMYHGMRGIKGLVNEISDHDSEGGIRFRGLRIEECRKFLPKAPNGLEPLPEGMFWLLCTGEIPTLEQVEAVSKELVHRAHLPPHVVTMLNQFSSNVPPMTQFSTAVTACNSESKFNEAYHDGVTKSTYWEFMYEDAMDLIAKLPTIAAIIYCNLYRDGNTVGAIDPSKDLAANFAYMLGYDIPKLREYLRLFLSLNCEHGAGSVCLHTSRLVGSALSDAYLSYSGGLNGLAGPIHGAANQEAMKYLTRAQKYLGKIYSESELHEYIWRTLKAEQVVPGFGHAVLRKTDPRYNAHRDFLQSHLPDYPLYRVANDIYRIVPDVLRKHGKVACPWPNVDAISGVGFHYYGITEIDFYPVFVGVSRSLGSMASLIWDRILSMPIERPKSMSTQNLMKMVSTN